MPESSLALTRSDMPVAACMAQTLPPRTLLLVEDSRLAAEAVRLICRRAGIRLRRAETLHSAHQHLKVYRPDIAMIDLGLPDGSGLDLIATLSRRADRPRRIVAVSGETAQRQAALEAGAQAFLLKPVTMAAHLAALTGSDERLATLPPGSAGVEPMVPYAPAIADRHDRNAGADPLALRDDLRRVRAMVQDCAGPEQLRYAGQFLASIGRAMGDTALARAAQRAARAHDRGALLALAEACEPAGPLL